MKKNYQQGTATVEFAIIASVFFMIIFATIEIGRTLFYWNSLVEATRRGARVASICPINHLAIKQVTLFKDPGGTEADGVLAGLDEDSIRLDYLDESENVIADPAAEFSAIEFVRVSIEEDIDFELLIPWLHEVLVLPAFSTVLPRESLGVPRTGVSPVCFGT